MSTYPINYEVPYQETHGRLSVLLRIILAIPIMVVVAVYGFVAEIAVIIAWFALLFTGKYPQGIYDFIAGYIRMAARANSYYYLLTDKYPPFSGAAEVDYPVRTDIAPPLESYDRLKVLVRLIIAIPMLILLYLISIWASLMGIAAWVVELITGKLPEGIYKQLVFCMRYSVRAAGYLLLLTQTYPPISDED